MFSRQDIEEREVLTLAPYALKAKFSRGREFKEQEDQYRTCFQRDRDRIIHSKSFRRLKGKTQVFTAHHNDHFRSRLTHTMEVAQISRDLARSFGLNEDLCECIALAHDLGHTPFGHAGQDILNQKMKEYYQNFEHNQQSIRIVRSLEKHSPHFSGLNLSLEVIEGLNKHQDNNLSLEAQLVNFCDEIAYLNHDLEDGLQSHILKISDLQQTQLGQEIILKTEIIDNYKLFAYKLKNNLIKLMTTNILDYSNQIIQDPKQTNKISFSPEFYQQKEEFKNFLFKKLYKTKDVSQMNKKGQVIISSLFDFLIQNPKSLPKKTEYQENTALQISDYLSSMTDAYIEKVYQTTI